MRKLLAIAIAIVGMQIAGCASVCHVIDPTVITARSYLDDAHMVIDRYRHLATTLEAQDAIEACDRALLSAGSALDAAHSACVETDVHAIFASFADAWIALVPILGLVAGQSGEPDVMRLYR